MSGGRGGAERADGRRGGALGAFLEDVHAARQRDPAAKSALEDYAAAQSDDPRPDITAALARNAANGTASADSSGGDSDA